MRALAVDSNGDIVVGGSFTNRHGQPAPNDPPATPTGPGQAVCNASPDQVVLYEDANYGLGGSQFCVVLDVGDYSNTDRIGARNDAVSSIRVGGMVEIQVWVDNAFSGATRPASTRVRTR